MAAVANEFVNLIPAATTLNVSQRKAADYSNVDASLNPQTNDEGVAYLTVMYDSLPADDSYVAELYVLPGDGEATETFPNGGDGTVGNDVDPADGFSIGPFQTGAGTSSTTVTEVLALKIPVGKLPPNTCRFVLVNRSSTVNFTDVKLDVKFNRISRT